MTKSYCENNKVNGTKSINTKGIIMLVMRPWAIVDYRYDLKNNKLRPQCCCCTS